MAKIVFAWELGSGSGHIIPFLSVANRLTASGHDIVFATRHPDRLSSISGNSFRHVNAPLVSRPSEALFANPQSLAEVLVNVGYGDQQAIESACHKWETLFATEKPDLVIVDHSPSALLALRGTETAVMLFGTGFVNPAPTESHSEVPCGIDSARAEQDLLRAMNGYLVSRKPSGFLKKLRDLYANHRETILTTTSELDHDRSRQNGFYVGSWPLPANLNAIEWPNGTGPKVFAYLKRSRGLGQLLDWLAKNDLPSIIVCDGIDVAPLRRIARPCMNFRSGPIPISQIANECDVAVLNASHNTTITMLLASTPLLQLPLHLEQRITAERTVAIGAGSIAPPNDGDRIVWELAHLMANNDARENAARFGESYRNYSVEHEVTRIVDRIRKIVG